MKKKMSMKELRPIMEAEFAKNNDFRMITHGTSMLPLIGDGCDTVILRPAVEELKKYDIPLYIRKDGSFVLHRIVGRNKDGYIMCGDNQIAKEHGITGDQILAVAAGVIKNEKIHMFCGIKYFLYSRLLCNVYRPLRTAASKIKQKLKKLFLK